jgi:hypothetical protein
VCGLQAPSKDMLPEDARRLMIHLLATYSIVPKHTRPWKATQTVWIVFIKFQITTLAIEYTSRIAAWHRIMGTNHSPLSNDLSSIMERMQPYEWRAASNTWYAVYLSVDLSNASIPRAVLISSSRSTMARHPCVQSKTVRSSYVRRDLRPDDKILQPGYGHPGRIITTWPGPAAP